MIACNDDWKVKKEAVLRRFDGGAQPMPALSEPLISEPTEGNLLP
jgi:hypothetical protein